MNILQRNAAAVLAAAATEVFPGTQLVDGQTTAEGFYYEFRFPFTFQRNFLTLLEEKMRALIKDKRAVVPLEMAPVSAAAFLEHHGQAVRAEIVRRLGVSLAPIFQMGGFVDLCVFPLIADTGELGVPLLYDFKEVGGALVRIYGSVFPDKASLKEFLKKQKTAPLKKGHEEWGEALELFTPCEVAGDGCWRWLPQGEQVRGRLLQWWEQCQRAQGFQLVSTPAADKRQAHLPLLQRYERVAECYYGEFEKSFWSAGMLASRSAFCDIAHMLCTPAKLLDECISSLQFMIKISKILGFEHQVVLCADGKHSAKVLAEALDACALEYSEDENVRASRIELRVPDSLGRLWTSAYLGLEGQRVDGEIVVYRSLFSSIERITALLIERYAGALPFWLAPEQVRVVAVDAKSGAAAAALRQRLLDAGIRAALDVDDMRLAPRVHRALDAKVPLLAIMGAKEQEVGMVTVRDQQTETTLSIEAFVQELMNRNSIEN